MKDDNSNFDLIDYYFLDKLDKINNIPSKNSDKWKLKDGFLLFIEQKNGKFIQNIYNKNNFKSYYLFILLENPKYLKEVGFVFPKNRFDSRFNLMNIIKEEKYKDIYKALRIELDINSYEIKKIHDITIPNGVLKYQIKIKDDSKMNIKEKEISNNRDKKLEEVNNVNNSNTNDNNISNKERTDNKKLNPGIDNKDNIKKLIISNNINKSNKDNKNINNNNNDNNNNNNSNNDKNNINNNINKNNNINNNINNINKNNNINNNNGNNNNDINKNYNINNNNSNNNLNNNINKNQVKKDINYNNNKNLNNNFINNNINNNNDNNKNNFNKNQIKNNINYNNNNNLNNINDNNDNNNNDINKNYNINNNNGNNNSLNNNNINKNANINNIKNNQIKNNINYNHNLNNNINNNKNTNNNIDNNKFKNNIKNNNINNNFNNNINNNLYNNNIYNNNINNNNINNNNIYNNNINNNINHIINNNNLEKQNLNKKYVFPTKGLDNIGSTCYMNSTLQCLLHVSELVNYFLYEYKKDKTILRNKNKNSSTNGKIPEAFYDLVNGVCNNNDGSISDTSISNINFLNPKSSINKYKNKEKIIKNNSFSPKNFKSILGYYNSQFKDFKANDSKDLLLYLLQTMHEELNYFGDNSPIRLPQPNQSNRESTFIYFMSLYNSQNFSIISKNFYGTYEIITTCHLCYTTIYNFQKFEFISFGMFKYKNKNFDIIDGFKDNEEPQVLKGNNRFYCNKCKKLIEASLSCKIIQPPNKLILNIDYGKNKKYQPSNINFDDIIDITKYVNFNFGTRIKYEITGICTHLGSSGKFGHYITFCKNKENKKWYSFNDSSCNEIKDKEEIYRGSPYILLYEKID